ncbi:hypothetical protein H5S09_03855 [Limosilactobacillus sp. STM2_1]|uniref:Uncharacterized protein n=2 Tax=Limosilactobacillus rudii TaxID=2759755 RepID=A0A7W3UK69_9LACO|nr:hypothetical protein [Limosilactobacillus rudii]MBB1097087.1 hypothetical protein [Limosilactobacillus rudii]
MKEMREKLKELGSQKRHEFIGEFVRLGYKNSFRTFRATLMLANVKLVENDELVTDHLWFNYTKSFLKLGELKEGDLIKFNARVNGYDKGYIVADTHDYRLVNPSKIKLVNNKIARQPMPIDNNAAMIGYAMKKNKQFYKENHRSYIQWYVDCYEYWLKQLDSNKG